MQRITLTMHLHLSTTDHIHDHSQSDLSDQREAHLTIVSVCSGLNNKWLSLGKKVVVWSYNKYFTVAYIM